MKNKIRPYYFFLIFFISCIKEELPVPVHVAGDIIVEQVEMGADYNTQIFYNLETTSIVSENLETDWEIAFDCSNTGSNVILNSSIVCSAFNTHNTNFDSIYQIPSSGWDYDDSEGDLDSTAITIDSNNYVYIINLGTSVSGGGIQRSYKKIIINEINNQQYQIRSAFLNGSMDTTITINKDTEVNFLAFSLTTNKVISIFPNKNSWDLMFTAYTHMFNEYTPPLPYRVSGVLINRNNTIVAEDTTYNFAEINYDLIQNSSILNYSSEINVIGYDWKNYSGTFTIKDNLNYIIRTNSGLYFKLRFTDFYNDDGIKGCPKFEFQKL